MFWKMTHNAILCKGRDSLNILLFSESLPFLHVLVKFWAKRPTSLFGKHTETVTATCIYRVYTLVSLTQKQKLSGLLNPFWSVVHSPLLGVELCGINISPHGCDKVINYSSTDIQFEKMEFLRLTYSNRFPAEQFRFLHTNSFRGATGGQIFCVHPRHEDQIRILGKRVLAAKRTADPSDGCRPASDSPLQLVFKRFAVHSWP